MSATGAERLKKTRAIVEAAITKLGLDPKKSLVGESTDQVSWTLARGSANVLITVVHRPEQKNVFFRVAAPVMTPDPSKPKEALFQRLLEMNAGGLANASFGWLGDKVVTVSERPAEGLDENEADQMIRHLSAVADTFDDRLVSEFGGKRASDG
jgi:hypothetical protein